MVDALFSFHLIIPTVTRIDLPTQNLTFDLFQEKLYEPRDPAYQQKLFPTCGTPIFELEKPVDRISDCTLKLLGLTFDLL